MREDAFVGIFHPAPSGTGTMAVYAPPKPFALLSFVRPADPGSYLWGPPPQAENDFATTAEETPVVIDVLANDRRGAGGDDDDDEESSFDIDRGTVDLEPGKGGIQASADTNEGTYRADVQGYVTFSPATGFSGTSSVQYTVNSRAEETSNAATISVTVTNANEAPVINGQKPDPLIIEEDQTVTITTDHLNVTDEGWPDGFTISAGSGDNYAVSGATITPATDYSGPLTVPVVVNDGELDSEEFPFKISVSPVNDAPLITGQNPDPITTARNEPVTLTLDNLEVTDPDDTYPERFELTVQEGANYTFSGTMVTPAQDYSGTLDVNVTVTDPHGASDTHVVKISVAGNVAPQITGQTPLSTNEETPLEISLSHLQVTDPDDNYPDGFTLSVRVGQNYSLSGNTITPDVNFVGTLTVPVVVNDGSSESAPFDVQVTVQNINDAPQITGHSPLTTPEGQPISLLPSHLSIQDPDPGDTFTLSVLPGDNYSVSGDQVTPSPGFSGPLTVAVFVSDAAGAASTPFDVTISVTPVNDPPVITGQRPLEVPEDTPILLTASDVTVSDPDNTSFTLAVREGADYTYSGNTVTPAANFTGTLSVNVVVNDGTTNSEPYPLQIAVTPLNDAPVITAQNAVTTAENTARTISFTDLVVTDPDNAYPTGFTLTVFGGDHYTASGSTVTPERGFSGELRIPVQVSDGLIGSNIYNLVMQVTPVNDPPVITGQTIVSTPEDVPVNLGLNHLTVLDPDNTYPVGFTLIVSPGSNYTVSGTTVTPATDFNGTLNVPVMVNDGTNNSAPFIFQIQVGNANDAPVITGQQPVSTNEETAVTLSLSHLTVSDPDNAFPSGFTLLVAPGLNYTVSGTTIVPATNFAGMLTVPVRVNDGINNSATFNLQVQVVQVNDPPSFAPVPNQQATENDPARSVTITDISKGPLEGDQQLTFVASSSNTGIVDNPVISYDGTGPSATLTWSPKPHASGVVTITIVAIDNGPSTPPHQNSYTSSFQIEVLPINTAPTLDVIADLTIQEDAEQQNITLSGITAGAGESQVITVTATAGNPDLFELLDVTYNSPETSGVLHLRPRPNAFGTTAVSVTATDNGSGVSPNVNSVTQTFTLTVLPVNDAPAFTSSPVTVAAVNEEYAYHIIVEDPDGEPVSVSAEVKPAWTSLEPVRNGEAILRGKAPATAVGEAPVSLQAKDAISAATQSFSIYVNIRPELASLSITAEEDETVSLPPGFFQSGYTDPNENPLQAVLITSLPASGKLLLSEAEVKAGDTIPASSLGVLRYTPDANFFGRDFIGWNAFDGYHLSSTPARVDFNILPVNDPPEIVFQTDTLRYEVNGEPAPVAPLADIIDPDDDTLTYAIVGFHDTNYSPQIDILEFAGTANIKGAFDYQSGILRLTGTASVDEYRTALRSVQYLHLNTLDPLLAPKAVYVTVHDGEAESLPKDKIILLQYTFIEFDIPSGFTPNGDQANDTWVIDRPGGGLEELDDAVIRVYNRRGVLVFQARGFDKPWDGTMNGEMLPADTYFYTIDLQLRNKKTYKGIVTILR